MRQLRPSLEWSASVPIGFDTGIGVITIAGRRLAEFIVYELNNARGVTWRDDTPKYYGLRRIGSSAGEGYIDASRWTEYPDFRSLGVSFPIPGSDVGGHVGASVDRFGNFYAIGGLSRGPGAGVAYAEGFIGGVVRRDSLPPEDPRFLEFCDELSLALRWGFGAGTCGSYEYLVLSEGVQAGGGITATGAVRLGKDPTLGWDRFVQDRLSRGTTFDSLFTSPETPFDTCTRNTPTGALAPR